MSKRLATTSSKPLLATVAVLSAALVIPAGASAAKTYRASATDPAGDAPSPNRDIIEVKMRYRTTGSILFVVTVAGPIDGVGADAGVGVSLGSSCKKSLLIGAGAFSAPDPVIYFKAPATKAQAKKTKPREGKGEITNNVYTLSAKHRSFKNFKPGCMAVALVDPATAESDAPVAFDQTAEIKF